MWNGALPTVSCTFCRPHLETVVRSPQFFSGFMWSTTWWRCGWHMKSSSRYNLVHILSTSSWKSGPDPSVFYDLRVKPSSRYSAIFQKWPGPASFLRFCCEIELSLQSRAHFVDRFPGSRRAPAETETLQRRPRTATLPEKNTGFCARECFQPCIHAFPIAHISQLLDDDVIGMMMWLTWLRWWCGCHNGETASHWQPSVTRKFPN